MDRRGLHILRTVFYVMLAWFVVSSLGRFHWFLVLFITTVAISNVAVVWMLREHRNRLAVACRRPVLRRYVAGVCFFTRDQIPLEASSDSPSREVRLRTARDFANAAKVGKQVVRGHDSVLDTTFSRIHENQTLRKTRRSRGESGPLASFLLVGEDGIGKRYLMRVLSKLLYGSSSIEVFDCRRITMSELVGTRDRCGDLLEIFCNKPHGLVLFEQVESASADINNNLVQLLTSGQLYQPGSDNPVSFQEAVVVLSSTTGAETIASLAADRIDTAAWHQQVTQLLIDETRIDASLLHAVTEICCLEPPSDLVKAEVVALLLKKECKAHNIELSHVDPEIVATQVFQIENGSGFNLVPQRVKKLLRKPLVAAAPQRAESLSLRVRTDDRYAEAETSGR